MRSVIDFHSHILPGIDDGSASIEESIALLKIEKQQGIDCVVATPHFYPLHDTPERFLRRRARAEKMLRERIGGNSDLPEIKIGAEVYYFNGISDSDVISELTIDGKRCILIEMPAPPWGESVYRELEALYVRRGILPIVAHIDRYISRFRTFGIPRRLSELPVLVQANAEFFLNRSTASTAIRMLKHDGIHLLGSDCHDLKTRKPNLGDALGRIRERLGEDVLERINEYEHDVLADS